MGYFSQILAAEGEDVTWHKRSLGVTPDPETGDLPVSWTTEIIKAIVQPARVDEVIVEAGYTVEDYVRIFVIVDVQYKDQVTYRNVKYEVLPPEAFYLRGTLEYKTALARRLLI